MTRICLIGLGEVGRILAEDLLAIGCRDVLVFDKKFADPESIPSRTVRELGLVAGRDAAGVASGADLIISAVTAGEAVSVASAAAAGCGPNSLFLDLNSISPAARIRIADRVHAAGSKCIEAAIMSPIAPRRSASPILLGGPHALECLPLLHELGFVNAAVFSNQIGKASAVKMCRSVIIKGIESLVLESLVSARHYGVEGAVLASLNDLLPVGDWREFARYTISRTIIHGRRRAEEMREAAETVRGAGLAPEMSLTTVARQNWAASRVNEASTSSLEELLDAVIASLDNQPEEHQC